MKKKITKAMALTMALSMMLGCMTTGSKVEAAKKVKLNKKNISLKVGETFKLKLKNSKGTVKWSTNKKKVAIVTKKGKVTAKKKGTAIITAKNKNKKYKCTVKVAKMVKPTPTAIPTATPTPTPTPIATPTPYSANIDFTIEKLTNGRISYSFKNNNTVDLYNIKFSVMGMDSEGKTIKTDSFTVAKLEAGETKTRARASNFPLKESTAVTKTLSAICVETENSNMSKFPINIDKTSNGNVHINWLNNKVLSDVTLMYKDIDNNIIDIRKNWRELEDNAVDFFDSVKTFMLPSLKNFDFKDIEVFL